MEIPDTNIVIAGLLRDLATVQTSTHSSWGYKRAASAIRELEDPIEAFVDQSGTLRKIPQIGPSSTRVILEVVRTGSSATVDEAIAKSPKRDDVERSRALREGFLSRAQVKAALYDKSLEGPTLQDYRGDLQMHSVWSDGSQTLDDLVRTGLARGYRYSAITDYSYGLPIARGMSMAKAAEQQKEIDSLNSLYAGRFRVLKGIEANMRADGGVDIEANELRQFEIVVAAPHSALRSPLDQSSRILRTVSTPGVHILGHPRGRMYGSRPGITADWDQVFAAAARTGVAVEIDGDPARQDLDYTLATKAAAAGCLLALDGDAHGVDQWQYAETAIAHARLAGVPRDQVINGWPLDRLMEWAERRKEGG